MQITAVTQRFAFGVCVFVLSVSSSVSAQNGSPQGNSSQVPAQIEAMAGKWSVAQRMWPGPGKDAVTLPAAVAERRLIGDKFLQETMELAQGGNKAEAFTRVAYFLYNEVNQQYEYFSLDTRGPQMMTERTQDAGGPTTAQRNAAVNMQGSVFVAPQWGDDKNVTFRYRLTISEVADNRQVVRLYFTRLASEPSSEFLAFEYIYTRR